MALFLLCNVALHLLLLCCFRPHFLSASISNEGQDELQALSGHGIYPSQLLPPSRWAAGSAFFTVMATCFGYYAQPRGSLLFTKSGRAWRLSPLFALSDTIMIFWVSSHALLRLRALKQPRPSLRTIAVSILVMRNANATDELKNTAGVKKYEGPKDRKKRKGDSPSAEGETLLLPLFDEVSHFESGPSFRIFVWGPMLLQLLKLTIVRGSPLARFLGFVFFTSWLIVDVLLIIASWEPLSSLESSQATFIVDDCNPRALYLAPGILLKAFQVSVFCAQSVFSIFLIIAFGTGGWKNLMAVETTGLIGMKQMWQVWAAIAISTVCYIEVLMLTDLTCTLWKNRGFDENRRVLSEGAPAFTAIIGWILLLLCFLSIPPLQSFHDTEKTLQPPWYEWLG